MSDLHSVAAAKQLMQILVSAFLAILFLQSGSDKVIDRQGNLSFLRQHFARSPLAGVVGPMFAAITVLELVAGILTGIGCVLILFGGNTIVSFYGAAFAAVAITALFFGQRLAKDYPGAAILVPYFFLATGAIYLFA